MIVIGTDWHKVQRMLSKCAVGCVKTQFADDKTADKKIAPKGAILKMR